MKINLSEDIRAFRKARKYTQEQLAEVMNVSVASVSKWESGATTPELGLIVELAGFFETSVDVLLGYEWRSLSMGRAIEDIKRLRKQKDFSECARVVESALKKFPNCFEVVYESASFYMISGLEMECKDSFRQALKLLERAEELIDQNADPKIGIVTLKRQMAMAYMVLDENEKALETFKKSNIEGCNESYIGNMLATEFHKPDEALTHLAEALTSATTELLQVAFVYSHAYKEKGELKKRLSILEWIYSVYDGLRPESGTSYIDRAQVMIGIQSAQTAARMGQKAEAKKHLQNAYASASRFDADPNFYTSSMRFFHGDEKRTLYDDFGETALKGLEQMLDSDTETRDELNEIWEDIKHEQLI